MSESRIWEGIRTGLSREGRPGAGFRLEEKATKGIPDSFIIALSGKTVWLELKKIDKASHQVEIETEQVNTLFKLRRLGAPAYCLIGIGRGAGDEWFLVFPPAELRLWQKLKEPMGLLSLYDDGHAEKFTSLHKVASFLLDH